MLPLIRHSFTKRISITLAFELLALNACFAIPLLTGGLHWSRIDLGTVGLFALSGTLAAQFGLWSFGLYSRRVIYSGQRVISNLLNSCIFTGVLLLPVCYLFYNFHHADDARRGFFDFFTWFYLPVIAGFMSFISLERMLVLRYFKDSPYLGDILILGTGPATAQVVAEAKKHHGEAFKLYGVLSENRDDVGKFLNGLKVIGCIDEIQEIVNGCDIRCVLISMPIYSPALPTEFLLKCKVRGILVLDSSEFYETLGKKVLLEKLDPIQLLLSENLLMTRFRWFLKNSSEKLIAIFLMILAAPLLLVTAILVRLTSPGPILYRQERLGKDGRVFRLLKFRSMVTGAEENGPVWAQVNDSRVTLVGRFLRKFRVDELPQLINVLRGEMAIVGPRPERPQFVDELARQIPFYSNRHLVHPGLTGWAQVTYPYGASIDEAREKLRYDLYYIKHMSFFFDAMIVVSTIRTVLFARGSR